MASLVSTSKAIGQMFKCNNGGRQLIRCLRNNSKVENRSFRSISRVETCQSIVNSHEVVLPFSHFSRSIQRRGFLGIGDGDEGNKSGVSKVHEETCIMG